MLKYLLPFLLMLFLFSCKNDNQIFSSLDCSSTIIYEGSSKLINWESETVENDTTFVQVYLDTIMYDETGIINTISYTWFKDKVSTNFDWDNYMTSENNSISNNFDLLSSGISMKKDTETHWFLVNDSLDLAYIEYQISNPLFIKQIRTSEKTNTINCHLINLSKQALSPVSP